METDSIRQELADMRRMLQQLLTAQKKMLTLKDVAVLTGWSVGYVRQLIERKALRHYRPQGKTVFVASADLDKFLHQNEVRTDEEIKAEARRVFNS